MPGPVDPNGLHAIDELLFGDGLPELVMSPEEASQVLDHLMIQVAKYAVIDSPDTSSDQKREAQATLTSLVEEHPETNELAFLARRIAAYRLHRKDAA